MTNKERLDRLEFFVYELAKTLEHVARMQDSDYYLEKEPRMIVEVLDKEFENLKDLWNDYK